jgi:hypothetical protein
MFGLQSDGDYADVGIIASVPTPGLCRICRDASSIPSVWRCFRTFLTN